MFFKLLLLFTLGPLLEIYLLIEVGRIIGTMETILLIVFTGVVGAAMARSQGTIILRRLKRNLSEGEMPGEEILNGLCVLLGGALLVTPGLVSDLVGFMLIIPYFRQPVKIYIKNKLKRMLQEGNVRIW